MDSAKKTKYKNINFSRSNWCIELLLSMKIIS